MEMRALSPVSYWPCESLMSEIIPPASSTTEFYRPLDIVYVSRPKQRYWLHALLLLATVFTTLVVGANMQFNFQHHQPAFSITSEDDLPFFPARWVFAQPSRLLLGIPFASTLMLILLAHEMGHYLYCRYYGVNATLPFFIPFPNLFGTMGAFIRIRSPIRSRAALFDIGIAGPIAGFVVATVVLMFALPLSQTMAAGAISPDVQLGYPLIFRLLWQLMPMTPAASPTMEAVNLHPMALAAWLGMFATALNLLPGGQLDGGHIVFSIAPRAHKQVSRLVILALIPMALFYCYIWVVWAIVLRLTSMRHPIVAEWPEVTGFRLYLGAFAIVILALTL